MGVRVRLGVAVRVAVALAVALGLLEGCGAVALQAALAHCSAAVSTRPEKTTDPSEASLTLRVLPGAPVTGAGAYEVKVLVAQTVIAPPPVAVATLPNALPVPLFPDVPPDPTVIVCTCPALSVDDPVKVMPLKPDGG